MQHSLPAAAWRLYVRVWTAIRSWRCGADARRVAGRCSSTEFKWLDRSFVSQSTVFTVSWYIGARQRSVMVLLCIMLLLFLVKIFIQSFGFCLGSLRQTDYLTTCPPFSLGCAFTSCTLLHLFATTLILAVNKLCCIFKFKKCWLFVRLKASSHWTFKVCHCRIHVTLFKPGSVMVTALDSWHKRSWVQFLTFLLLSDNYLGQVVYTQASVTKQCNLVPAGKVAVCLASD